jgi:hypothetical protein
MNHPSTSEPENIGARRRVSEALAIDIARVLTLPPFDPRTEERPGAPDRPRRRAPYMKAARVDAELEPLKPDATAGVPDALVAQRSGRSVGQVRQWRRRQGVRGRRGRPSHALSTKYMVGSLLGRDAPRLHHQVSPVHGAWTAPEYVLREPLAYSAFAEITFRLATELGYDPADIARGIGVFERDVQNAIALYGARGAR